MSNLLVGSFGNVFVRCCATLATWRLVCLSVSDANATHLSVKFNRTDIQVVTVMISTMQWLQYSLNILPSNLTRVVVVLDNACDAVEHVLFT